jgi:hypothetical protein
VYCVRGNNTHQTTMPFRTIHVGRLEELTHPDNTNPIRPYIFVSYIHKKEMQCRFLSHTHPNSHNKIFNKKKKTDQSIPPENSQAHQRSPNKTEKPSTMSQMIWTRMRAWPEIGPGSPLPLPTSQYPNLVTLVPAQAASRQPHQ